MLRIANSALFGPRYPVTGVLHAAAMLGIDRVRSMVTTVALKDFVGKARKTPAVSRCWRHNLACAIVCEDIARKSRMDRDFAYTSGLLHDIGRLAMIRAWLPRYAVLLDAASDSEALLQLEFDGFGIRHTRAGYLLVKGWRLPNAFAEIADRHHASQPATPDDMAALVQFGCSLADRLGFGVAGQPAAQTGDPQAGPPPAFEELVAGNLESLGVRVAEHINELECCLAA
jgi:putative nucleotidyltransferase with HDIG domain